jgi:hypothetical protein
VKCRATLIMSVPFVLMARMASADGPDHISVETSVHADVPDLRLRSSVPSSLNEPNVVRHFDPREVWIAEDEAEGIADTPMGRGRWRAVRHPVTGERGWAADWYLNEVPSLAPRQNESGDGGNVDAGVRPTSTDGDSLTLAKEANELAKTQTKLATWDVVLAALALALTVLGGKRVLKLCERRWKRPNTTTRHSETVKSGTYGHCGRTARGSWYVPRTKRGAA